MSATWPQVAFASLMRRAILVVIIICCCCCYHCGHYRRVCCAINFAWLARTNVFKCTSASRHTHTHIDSDCVSVACLCLLRLISALSCAFYSEKRNETMFALIAKHEFEGQIQILLCTTVCTCRCVSLRVSLHNTCVSCKKKQTNSILAPRPECKSRWPTSPPPSTKNDQNESQHS